MLVCFASLMHLLWGMLIFAGGGEIAIAATRVMSHLVPDHNIHAITYIIVALLPIVLLKRPGSIAGIISVLPQQLLLILSGISSIVAISTGTYADGTMRSPLFIAADQGIYIILAILYALESIDRFHERD